MFDDGVTMKLPKVQDAPKAVEGDVSGDSDSDVDWFFAPGTLSKKTKKGAVEGGDGEDDEAAGAPAKKSRTAAGSAAGQGDNDGVPNPAGKAKARAGGIPKPPKRPG